MKFWTNTTVGSVDIEKRTIKFIASTTETDSYDEIVEQDWILNRWVRNSAVLWSHNRNAFGKDSFPVGRGLSAELKDSQLEIDVEFAPEELNEFADSVFRNAAAGFIRGASVGFYPHDVRLEKRNGKEVFVLRQNELLELTICPVGANPGAVSLAGDEDPEERRKFLRSLAAKTEKNMEDENDNIETDVPAVMLDDGPPVAGNKEPAQEPAPQQTVQLSLPAVDAAVDAIAKAADVLKMDSELGKARAENAELRARNADLEDQLAKLDVEKLVGVKLTPVEFDVAVADRKREGRQAFEARMAKRPDLQLTNQIVRDGNRPSLSNADAGRRFADRINNKAQGQAPNRSAQ